MKRLTRYSLFAAIPIAMAGAAIAALFWLTATTQGARWLLATVTPLTGINLSVQKIEGRVIDHLLLKEVRLTLAQQKMEIDSLDLRWKPLLLLAGTVAVQELTINGVRIQDDAPPGNKPPVLAWPKASQTAQLFDGRILRLLVKDFSYRHLQEQPVQISAVAGSLSWQDGLLSVSDLKAEAPSGRITGSVSAGLKQPSLITNLAVVLTHPVAEMDRFSLQIIRSGQKGPEPLVGKVTVSGAAGARKLLEITGDVGMARNAFNLRRLSLTKTGRKGLLTADGSLAFTARESLLTLQVKATGLDLAPELKMPTDLSGTLKFAGTLDSYRGDFMLANKAKGWQAATLSAAYQGTSKGVKLSPLKAVILDGNLTGNMEMDWRDGFALQAVISGRNLNPARLDPGWKGVANFDASGNLAWSGKSPLTGSVSGSLLESRLHGQALTGDMQADFADNNLYLSRLALHGKGFDLKASGNLNQRLVMEAQISDFSRLVPGSAGTLRSNGWVRWNDGQLSGSMVGSGSRLAYDGTQVKTADLAVRLDQGPGYPMHVNATLRDVIHGDYRLDNVLLAADGTLQQHTLNATLHSAGSEARLELAAGYEAAVWKGKLTRLAGRDSNGPWNMTAPTAFVVSAGKFNLSTLTLKAGTAERLEVAADLTLDPLLGQVRAQWSGLNLARANPYLKDLQIKGNSHGNLRLDLLPGKQLALAGSAAGSGTFSSQGHSMTLQRSLINFDGSQKGLRVDLELDAADGGRLRGTFSSAAPFSLTMPEKGALTAEWSTIDLALLNPWLPSDTVLEGHISGSAKGFMLPGNSFELGGSAVLSGGNLYQARPDGELKLVFSSASTKWNWRGEALSGSLALAMAEYGQAKASFQLPIPAHFPIAVNPKGPLKVSLNGKAQEKGIITALFPGLVQESFGELDAELEVGGSWETPVIGGKLQLAKAGAYLPTAGIHLKDVQLTASLEKNLIRIDSYRAVSGPGHIEGNALLTMDGWNLVSYRGVINGENFQTVKFPEFQFLSTPKLSFEGTPQKLILGGELRLPELNIVGEQSRKVITPSSDVVFEGRVVPAARVAPIIVTGQVRVLLGEKVFVKTAGIDAHLGGTIDLTLNGFDRITSKGEINVIKGRYRTYGVNLEIVRGRLFFSGGSIQYPTLDFLALRTIGDVRAGVTVTGNIRKPITKLYSEPAMPDVDVLAYVVLGHPLGSSGEQASLLTQAAGALLTSGQAGVLQEQLKDRLGLSTLEIQGGVGRTTGAMGYKPLQVTAPGSIPASQQPGVTETVLTVGKYLTPDLYISYGRSLFTGSNLFRLRYDIYKKWQIETQTGSDESGVDLFYKLEFK